MTVSPPLMARVDLRGAELSAARLRAVLPRGGVDVDAVLDTVGPIVDAVAARGGMQAIDRIERFGTNRVGDCKHGENLIAFDQVGC